jgi:hypothetical protein
MRWVVTVATLLLALSRMQSSFAQPVDVVLTPLAPAGTPSSAASPTSATPIAREADDSGGIGSRLLGQQAAAQARADGGWEAHVVSSDATPAHWPSVNGPSAAIALDALEAELRELLRCTAALPDAE